MTAPTAPYCGTSDVAALVPQLVRNASDFSHQTTPVKVVAEKLVTWCSAEIGQKFSAVGFYVPFQEISGEDWPEAQTYMLELITAMGAAGMIVGPVIKPAPAMGRDGGSSDNGLTAAYKSFIESIDIDGAGFRMYYRIGSKAEQFCRTPKGPVTDYLNGYLDPTLFQTTGEYTAVLEKLRSDYQIGTSQYNWDHLKTKRESLVGTVT